MTKTASCLYRCPCVEYREDSSSSSTQTASFHPLASLYFCEECDAIRCDDCVLHEVAAYHCPNCLFEVPMAGVRAERNRCARNCFQCPSCSNILSITASDATDPEVVSNPSSAAASTGELPYYLSCAVCKWDSKSSLNMTFEKPSGLAGQYQKVHETPPIQYEQLRLHLENYLKANIAIAAASRTSNARQPTAAIAAAVRALSYSAAPANRDIPSSIATASKFNSLHNLALAAAQSHSPHHGRQLSRANQRGSLEAASQTSTDDIAPFVTKQNGQSNSVRDERQRLVAIRSAKTVDVLSCFEQRSPPTHSAPILSNMVKPLRVPLRPTKSKRCDQCRHILIKPDHKAAAMKYKMRLLASNYIPQIDVLRVVPTSVGPRVSAMGATPQPGRSRVASSTTSRPSVVVVGSTADAAEPLRPGRRYAYQVVFTNPLEEEIQVSVQLAHLVDQETLARTLTRRSHDEKIEQASEAPASFRHFQSSRWRVTLPTNPAPLEFGIGPFAEDWEYEHDTGQDGYEEYDGGGDAGSGDGQSRLRGRRGYAPGVLSRKANRTAVAIELQTGREASGHIRVPLLIRYTYSSDDGPGTPSVTSPPGADRVDPLDAVSKAETGAAESKSTKTFSFWTLVSLGKVVPRVVAAGTTALVLA